MEYTEHHLTTAAQPCTGPAEGPAPSAKPTGGSRGQVRAPDTLGLSPTHITPQRRRSRLSPLVQVAEGGSVLRLRGRAPNAPKSRRSGGGLRGSITGFSKASARRLGLMLAAINQAAVSPLPLFITLTYPAQFSADSRCWKRHLERFIKRLRRRFDVAAVVWKLEPQERGAPHFHLLVFRHEDIPRQWVSQAWFQVVGSGRAEHLRAGTRVEVIRSWRGVMSYASKRYMGKLVDRVPSWWKRPGRFWGVVGELPIQWREGRTSELAHRSMARVCRRYLARKLGRGIKVFPGAGLTLRLPYAAALRLLAWATPLHPLPSPIPQLTP